MVNQWELEALLADMQYWLAANRQTRMSADQAVLAWVENLREILNEGD